MRKQSGANTARGRRREKRRAPEKGARQGAGSIENRSCIVQGRVFLTANTAVTYTAFNLVLATFGDRAVAVGDLYAEWRPRMIKLSIAPSGIVSGASAAPVNIVLAACYPDAIAVVPTALEEVCDFPAFAQGNGLVGAPYPKLSLSRAFWKQRPTDWLFTQSAIVTGTFLETCGQVLVGSPDILASVYNQRVFMEWELEFRSMLDPAVSAARIKERCMEEYKLEFPVLSASAAPQYSNSTTSASTEGSRVRPCDHEDDDGVVVIKPTTFAERMRSSSVMAGQSLPKSVPTSTPRVGPR